MTKALLFFPLLLCTGAFAQEQARTMGLTSPVAAGTVRTAGAIDHLTATNVVERGATAHYSAGQSVTLQPGFTAQAGSVFQAVISPADGHKAEPGSITASVYPNPFRTTATLTYTLPEATRVTHTLMDVQGRPLRQVNSPNVEQAGQHNQAIDAANLPVGTYLYQVRTNQESRVIRLVKE